MYGKMTSRTLRALFFVSVSILIITIGYHPVFILAFGLGLIIPDVDSLDPRFHRSWVFHTFLPSAIAYQMLVISNVGTRYPPFVTGIHFVTIGMFFHFLLDYVYPKGMSNDGSSWPIKPTIFSSPWGLMWLGFSWLIQWFAYLSIAFLPWLVP